jgi:hypothetical protein
MTTDPGEDDRGDAGQGAATRRGAVIGLIVVLLLVVVGYFLMEASRHESNLEDCLMSGRRNCAPIDLPQNRQ